MTALLFVHLHPAHVVLISIASLGLFSCRSTPAPPKRPALRADAARPDVWRFESVDAAMDVVQDALPDVSPDVSPDGASETVLTIRVVNASAQPMKVYVNPDANEMLHTRKLYAARRTGVATALAAEGELVKFFTIGQMPLCSTDAGAGYGGLGQPEQRPLGPGEALTFEWDGNLRREVLNPGRGVCAEITVVEPGRYRFEFDQPYGAPVCNRPVVVLPLAPDAPRTVEIRCVPRPHRPGEAS